MEIFGYTFTSPWEHFFLFSAYVTVFTVAWHVLGYCVKQNWPSKVTDEMFQKDVLLWTLFIYGTPVLNVFSVIYTVLYVAFDCMRYYLWIYLRDDITVVQVDGANNLNIVREAELRGRSRTTYAISRLPMGSWLMSCTFQESDNSAVSQYMEDEDLECLIHRWNEDEIAEYGLIKRFAFWACKNKLY